MHAAGSLALVGGAALVAGAVNAIAGGGSLITFPALTAMGLPPVIASLTNTVAMVPGYLGATWAQRKQLAGQRARLRLLLPVAAVGGIGGALLLLVAGASAFARVVPFLILFAAVLVGVQDALRRWLFSPERARKAEAWAVIPVAAAAIYGGYFGAGMGMIVLAALGVVLADSLVRLNALKQAVTLAANGTAAVVFAISGEVDWPFAIAMSIGSLAGGIVGGAIASRVPSRVLRIVIVVGGVSVAAIYFARW